MRLLIDTQVILWFQSSDEKLSNRAKELIFDGNNTCYISMASLWEMAIKINLNKLIIGLPFEDFPEYLIANNFSILNLEFSHLKTLSILGNHHRDPFDRLLIAQSIAEQMPILSADPHFQSYDVELLW
jgi:PIN domain nuclease of toxin-antitoxin system